MRLLVELEKYELDQVLAYQHPDVGLWSVAAEKRVSR